MNLNQTELIDFVPYLKNFEDSNLINQSTKRD